MTIDEILLICELANYKNFNEASLYISYSASAITKYVNNIENELGLKIFIRSNKSRDLCLTEEGKVLMDSLKRIAEDYRVMKRIAGSLKNDETSSLRLAFQPRFGNLHEQNIFTDYLVKHPSSQVNIIKTTADEIIRGIGSGQIDAAFATFHESVLLDELFGDKLSHITATLITTENEMYAGISEDYFKGVNEVNLKELEDFTFAVPFPAEHDAQSVKAKESWSRIAKEKSMKLKIRNLHGYDTSVFELARRDKIVVTTTHIPNAKFDGVKFLKIADWTGKTNLYFLHNKNNRIQPVKDLYQCTVEYADKLKV